MPLSLHVPDRILALAQLPRRHAFADRNTVLVEAALFHGLGSTDIARLDVGDVDLPRQCLRRSGTSQWLPLHSLHRASWERVIDGADAARPLCLSKSGQRMTRVDVWRVLRRVGLEAELARPLHTRRTRKWVGYALARRIQVDASSLALVLGVSDLRAVAHYLPRGNVKNLPLMDAALTASVEKLSTSER